MVLYGIQLRFAVIVLAGLCYILASLDTIGLLTPMDIMHVASISAMVDMSLHHIPMNVVVGILSVVRKTNDNEIHC